MLGDHWKKMVVNWDILWQREMKVIWNQIASSDSK